MEVETKSTESFKPSGQGEIYYKENNKSNDLKKQFSV